MLNLICVYTAKKLAKEKNSTDASAPSVRFSISANDAIERAVNYNHYVGRMKCNGAQLKAAYYYEVVDDITFGQHGTENLTTTTFAEDDLEMGLRTLLANIYCPDENIAWVYLFLRNLISHQTPRTIIQAVVNLAQSERIQGTTSQKMVNQFYLALDRVFHMEYGNNLLATSSRAQLQDMIQKDYPFFMHHKLDVQSCLTNMSCQVVTNIVENLGK